MRGILNEYTFRGIEAFLSDARLFKKSEVFLIHLRRI
jgi:hypothetical protein